jgi:hypothetical protein
MQQDPAWKVSQQKSVIPVCALFEQQQSHNTNSNTTCTATRHGLLSCLLLLLLCPPCRRVAAEVEGDVLGEEFKGYVFKIMGGQDKQVRGSKLGNESMNKSMSIGTEGRGHGAVGPGSWVARTSRDVCSDGVWHLGARGIQHGVWWVRPRGRLWIHCGLTMGA